MALPADASTAAAVSALFLLATLAAPLNFRLTGKGFKLYIPLGISTAFRGIAHAARASFLVDHNMDLMAVYGALNAAGFGIAVAMCCCFMVIWLRNAAHYQTPAVARLIATACKLLVACVIAFGPVLGVVAAGVVYGSIGDPTPMLHGVHIRVASSSGFTAVSAIALLFSCYLSLSWLIHGRRAAAAASKTAPARAPPASDVCSTPSAADAADPTHSHPQQQQQQQRRQEDGLVFVLPTCLALLLWCAASRLAQYDHPEITSSRVLYHAVSVQPELIVAFVFAAPTLAARVALGGRYRDWLQQQQQQRKQQQQRGGVGEEGRGASRAGGSSSSLGSDAEVGIEAARVQLASKNP